jgi:hypothetical protein
MIKTRLFFSKKECINPECVLSNKRGNKMEFTKKQEQVMVAAQTAYEAYCEYTGWKSLATGADLPKWENLRQSAGKAPDFSRGMKGAMRPALHKRRPHVV